MREHLSDPYQNKTTHYLYTKSITEYYKQASLIALPTHNLFLCVLTSHEKRAPLSPATTHHHHAGGVGYL